MSQPFDPLDRKNLAYSIGQAILSASPVRMDQLNRFEGAGLYAIYYSGNNDTYSELSALNQNGNLNCPIYVGKADPKGKRKGISDDLAAKGTPLYSRLTKHAASISAANNLELSDFYCQYLIVEDIWIPLGEALLISKYMPIWNNFLDGFGNNDPGSGRYNQLRSRWDVLHPGREWALKCRERSETSTQISSEVKEHIKYSVVPALSSQPVAPQQDLDL